MSKAPHVVNAVILDMDNTLYDWISYFVPAVRAMLAEAARLLNIDEESLRADIRTVHVARGNVEHPFALLETQAVAMRLPGLSRPERYELLKPAFAVFNDVRNKRLRLYPGVFETLTVIKDTGCRLLGHTEATDINISNRIRSLGLHGTFEAIYAPRSAGLGHPLGNKHGGSTERVPVRRLPSAARKPDPIAIRHILSDIDMEANRCLYVGDSITKDVTMAKRAGMLAAWARYGTKHDPQLWRDLVDISHWDAASVAAAKNRPDEVTNFQPDVTLDSFEELLCHFTFSAL
jgi:phosphoglycolate phosphatase-like HAD superfamily hydrolase